MTESTIPRSPSGSDGRRSPFAKRGSLRRIDQTAASGLKAFATPQLAGPGFYIGTSPGGWRRCSREATHAIRDRSSSSWAPRSRTALLVSRTFSILIGHRARDSDFSSAIHEGKSRSVGDLAARATMQKPT
jgi:hypothetical protein